MVGVKHEHAPAGSDGSLTSREQRSMLFSSEVFILLVTRDDGKSGERWAMIMMMVDNDGGAPEND
jgi:hypothetical protein